MKLVTVFQVAAGMTFGALAYTYFQPIGDPVYVALSPAYLALVIAYAVEKLSRNDA